MAAYILHVRKRGAAEHGRQTGELQVLIVSISVTSLLLRHYRRQEVQLLCHRCSSGIQILPEASPLKTGESHVEIAASASLTPENLLGGLAFC